MPRKTKPGTGKNESPIMVYLGKRMWILYLIFALLLIFYVLLNNALVGLLAFLLIVGIIVMEAKETFAHEGLKKGVWDIGVAIGAALAIWLILIIFLNTSAPIDVVASCSMLPVLHRGDLVALHGIANFTKFTNADNIPVVSVSQAEFSNFESSINSEFLAYYAYFNNDRSNISQVVPVGNNNYNIALYSSLCISRYQYLNQPSKYNLCYVGGNPSSNLIKYTYSMHSITNGAVAAKIIVTDNVTIGNTNVHENYANPIIVYATTPQDAFSGDIIHRLMAVLNVGGTYYMLTKGDNNPALDLQFGNHPAKQSSVVGYVLAQIPIIGYFKLVLSGELSGTAGCNTTISNH